MTAEVGYLEFRRYVNHLLRRWWLIAIGAAVGSLAALLATAAIQPTYQGEAVLMTSAPAPSLAAALISDPILQATIDSLGAGLPQQIAQVSELRRRLTASQPVNSLLVNLTATDSDGALAMRIVNAWAQAIVQRQAAATSADDLSVLQTRQRTTTFLIASVTQTLYELEWSMEDARTLHDRLARRDPATEATFEDQAVVLSLVLRTTDATNVSLELQGALPDRTVGEQIRYLEDVQLSLQQRYDRLQQRLEQLRADQADIRAQLFALQPLFSSDLSINILQQAEMPDAPLAPQPLRATVLGGVSGLVAMALLILGWELGRSRRVTEA